MLHAMRCQLRASLHRLRVVPTLVLVLLLALPAITLARAAGHPGDGAHDDPGPSADPSADGAAWRILAAVRDSLVEAGPTRASFTQTFIPAGFSSGDQERGTLSIDLPECLRWDYAEPYPKAFLLCGSSAHLWNPEDGTGRRYSVERDKEPGLDLVLLGIEELEGRYRVQSETADGDVDSGDLMSIHLTPLDPGGQITGATLRVDRRTNRLAGLSYTDDEGNLTRFEIEGYRPLDEKGVFSAPKDIEWTEEEP
jgi:outer membrane lipoprotein-sorting protein